MPTEEPCPDPDDFGLDLDDEIELELDDDLERDARPVRRRPSWWRRALAAVMNAVGAPVESRPTMISQLEAGPPPVVQIDDKDLPYQDAVRSRGGTDPDPAVSDPAREETQVFPTGWGWYRPVDGEWWPMNVSFESEEEALRRLADLLRLLGMCIGDLPIDPENAAAVLTMLDQVEVRELFDDQFPQPEWW